MRLGRSGCRRGGLPPPLEKGRVGEGIKRRRRLIPTRLAPLADLPFSRRGKPSLLHRIDSTKIHHALATSSDHECPDAAFDAAPTKSVRQSFSRLFSRFLQAGRIASLDFIPQRRALAVGN